MVSAIGVARISASNASSVRQSAIFLKNNSPPMPETIPDQWQYQILVRIIKKHHVILVCDEKNRTAVQEMKMEYAADLEEAMQKAASALGSIEAASITVIPDGVSVIGI